MVTSVLTFACARTEKKSDLLLDENIDVDQLFEKFKAENGTSFL